MSLSFSDQAIKKNSPNRKKGITISVTFENLSPIYQIASEKLSLKKLKSLKKCMSSLAFCYPAILQFSVVAISIVIACKELKITQIVQINQLFQLLN